MAYISRESSTLIYIIHPIFITLFAVVVSKIDMSQIYICVALVVVYGASILFVVCMNKIFLDVRISLSVG